MALTCRSIKFLCRIARDIVGWAVSLVDVEVVK
jgi:hypothetical protein